MHEELKKVNSNEKSQTTDEYNQVHTTTPISNPSELQAKLQLPP